MKASSRAFLMRQPLCGPMSCTTVVKSGTPWLAFCRSGTVPSTWSAWAMVSASTSPLSVALTAATRLASAAWACWFWITSWATTRSGEAGLTVERSFMRISKLSDPGWIAVSGRRPVALAHRAFFQCPRGARKRPRLRGKGLRGSEVLGRGYQL